MGSYDLKAKGIEDIITKTTCILRNLLLFRLMEIVSGS